MTEPRLTFEEPLKFAGQLLGILAPALARARMARQGALEKHGLGRPATRQALEADRIRGMAHTAEAERYLVHLSQEVAGQVRADPAWPALAARLGDVAGAGHDPARVLVHVAGERELHTAGSVAEVLHWRVGEFLTDPSRSYGWQAHARTADTLAAQARTAAGETATRPDDPVTTLVDEHDTARGEASADAAEQATETAEAAAARAAANTASRVFVVTNLPAHAGRRPDGTVASRGRAAPARVPTRSR